MIQEDPIGTVAAGWRITRLERPLQKNNKPLVARAVAFERRDDLGRGQWSGPVCTARLESFVSWSW